MSVAFVFSLDVHAQTQPQPSPWAYDDLVRLVLEHHPDRQRAVFEERLALAQHELDVDLVPTFNSAGFRLPGAQGQPATYYEGQVDLTLPSWGQMRAQRVLLSNVQQSADARVHEQSTSVQLEVEKLILEWIELDDRLEVWGRHLDLSRQLATWYEARWAQGEASQSEAQIARWKWQHADHAYHEDWMRKEDIAALLRWACGDPQLALDSIVPPPFDLNGLKAQELTQARRSSDAGLHRLASDSAQAQAARTWTQKSLAPQWSLGYNGQGFQGDVYQGPFLGLTWSPGAARKQRRVAEVECDQATWELEAHRHRLDQDLAQLWRRHEARTEHLATWYASEPAVSNVTEKSLELLQSHDLDLPSFFALWEAELARQLDQIACESELRWLRAQLLIGTSFSSIEQP